MITRRHLLGAAAAAGAALPLSAVPRSVQAQVSGRVLSVNVVANSLGIHIPYMAALNDILPTYKGYARPKVERVSRLETITQSILSGSVEAGTGDAISTLRAVEAGADLKIIGNAFMNTSLVFVGNKAKIAVVKDLEKPGVTVAVNSPGDFTHVMLIKPLRKAGVDIKKVNVITMGGSGTRLRALLADRVDAVPIHFDQAQDLPADKYHVLIRPWDVYENFLGEVWMVSGKWLEKPENQRAAVDLLKATIQSFRRAQEDLAWYAAAYRQYGTDASMAKDTDATIDGIRKTLAEQVKAWPRDMNHRLAIYQELVPVYKEADAVKGTADLSKVIDTRLSEQALKELGQR